MPKEEAAHAAVAAFRAVFEYGPKIELDHHLVYHTRTCHMLICPYYPGPTNISLSDIFNADYELGRLLACQGDEEGARNEFGLVLSGKPLEVSASGRKVSYILSNLYSNQQLY